MKKKVLWATLILLVVAFFAPAVVPFGANEAEAAPSVEKGPSNPLDEFLFWDRACESWGQ